MNHILVKYVAFNSNDVFECTSKKALDALNNGVSHMDVLEVVFRECNYVDGSEWIADKKLRSMCVDDVVTLIENGAANSYVCAGIGWEKIANPLDIYNKDARVVA